MGIFRELLPQEINSGGLFRELQSQEKNLEFQLHEAIHACGVILPLTEGNTLIYHHPMTDSSPYGIFNHLIEYTRSNAPDLYIKSSCFT
jgi:hypothetical protein